MINIPKFPVCDNLNIVIIPLPVLFFLFVYIPPQKILHIFGDTTLEFPMTEQYVAQYKKENPKTPMISSRNKEKNFEELCEIVGPPSRVMRWCCTIFKTGAINQKISALFRGKKRIVAFQGIRHSESASRSKYERTSTNTAATQNNVSSFAISSGWIFRYAHTSQSSVAFNGRTGCFWKIFRSIPVSFETFCMSIWCIFI